MKITFSDPAIADLQNISKYTLDTWGKLKEQQYLDHIYSRIEQIASDPTRWKSRSEIHPTCQSAPAGKHIIFFTSDNSTIQIARILHAQMDIDAHINDQDFL